MFLQALTIARNALVESLRQPIVFVLVLISGVLQMFSVWGTGFSMSQTEASEVQGDDKLFLDFGLGTVFVMGTLLAGFVATAVMSREIENKTVLTVVSKPVGRPVLVVGKYLGVTGAILMSVIVMLVFLLLGVRHQVMSTTADELDGPVLLCGLGGVALSLALAGWCNYFYGWSFPQTVMGLLLVVLVPGYLLVLCLSKNWGWQSPLTDFKPQVVLACVCLVLAIVVLTAVATAASTRLGQVMTIAVCMGVFMLSLMSNYLFGRHAFKNESVGVVATARPDEVTKPRFMLGERYHVELEQAPRRPVPAGGSVYYGPTPNGFPLKTRFEPLPALPANAEASARMSAGAPEGVVAEASQGRRMTLRHVGGAQGTAVTQPPEPGDYVFLAPTGVNAAALAAWGVVPNLQVFWLLDAVSQNRPVPGEYLVMALLYALAQVGVYLSAAVLLFQKRDVG